MQALTPKYHGRGGANIIMPRPRVARVDTGSFVDFWVTDWWHFCRDFYYVFFNPRQIFFFGILLIMIIINVWLSSHLHKSANPKKKDPQALKIILLQPKKEVPKPKIKTVKPPPPKPAPIKKVSKPQPKKVAAQPKVKPKATPKPKVKAKPKAKAKLTPKPKPLPKPKLKIQIKLPDVKIPAKKVETVKKKKVRKIPKLNLDMKFDVKTPQIKNKLPSTKKQLVTKRKTRNQKQNLIIPDLKLEDSLAPKKNVDIQFDEKAIKTTRRRTSLSPNAKIDKNQVNVSISMNTDVIEANQTTTNEPVRTSKSRIKFDAPQETTIDVAEEPITGQTTIPTIVNQSVTTNTKSGHRPANTFETADPENLDIEIAANGDEIPLENQAEPIIVAPHREAQKLSTQMSGGNYSNMDFEVKGHSLLTLRSCGAREKALKSKLAKLVQRANYPKKCIEKTGKYVFYWPQYRFTVQNFNVIIYPAKGRVAKDRCEELKYACDCFENKN